MFRTNAFQTMFGSSLVFVLVLALGGCSGDNTIVTDDSDANMVSGEVNPNASSFEYEISASEDPSRPGGPYLLRGSNIRYDDTIGALLVDLTVTNRGDQSHPEPVVLTFVQLIPGDVTVLNSDNEKSGRGATIVFEFANDDAVWTPGEESLARTVQFAVAPETSIGFAARLSVGMRSGTGAIGGVVWIDSNRNGEREADELGLGGVEILLKAQTSDNLMPPKILRRTITRQDGSYRFGDLAAGYYIVFKRTMEDLGTTTPGELNVVLVRTSDGVSEFLQADFGCIFDNALLIEPGDFVRVFGKFDPAGDGSLIAREIVVSKCDDRGCVKPALLAGPVTRANYDELALRIMSEWVSFDANTMSSLDGDDLDPRDVQVGDRVVAGVEDTANGVLEPLPGFDLQEWEEEGELVKGYVKRVGGMQTDQPLLIVLRRTLVLITDETFIRIDEY